MNQTENKEEETEDTDSVFDNNNYKFSGPAMIEVIMHWKEGDIKHE